MTKYIEMLELQPLVADSVSGASLVPRDLALFGHVNVRVTVEVGHAELPIEKLLSSKAGEVLTLAEPVDAPVTLLVNGKPVARGQLVAVEDNFGVQITEIA